MWHWNVRKNHGFTLIEMLATAIIIAIVSAIAVPNLLGLVNTLPRSTSVLGSLLMKVTIITLE